MVCSEPRRTDRASILRSARRNVESIFAGELLVALWFRKVMQKLRAMSCTGTKFDTLPATEGCSNRCVAAQSQVDFSKARTQPTRPDVKNISCSAARCCGRLSARVSCRRSLVSSPPVCVASPRALGAAWLEASGATSCRGEERSVTSAQSRFTSSELRALSVSWPSASSTTQIKFGTISVAEYVLQTIIPLQPFC